MLTIYHLALVLLLAVEPWLVTMVLLPKVTAKISALVVAAVVQFPLVALTSASSWLRDTCTRSMVLLLSGTTMPI